MICRAIKVRIVSNRLRLTCPVYRATWIGTSWTQTCQFRPPQLFSEISVFPNTPSEFSVCCFWIDKGLSQCLFFHPLILILPTAKIIVRFKFHEPRHQPIKRPFSQLIEFEFAQLFEHSPSDFKCLQHNNQHRDFRINEFNDADSLVGDIKTSLP